VVVWAVKESSNLYGDNYICSGEYRFLGIHAFKMFISSSSLMSEEGIVMDVTDFWGIITLSLIQNFSISLKKD
jgi:hypothetical protein